MIMIEEKILAHAPCFTCKTAFWFHPDLVPSVWIDPATGLPPDLGGDPERARQEPLCPRCIRETLNPALRKAGKPTLSEHDTSNPATWGGAR